MARDDRDDFYCGFAAAVADLIRVFDQPTMAADLLKRSGITVELLEKSGVEDFDLQPIREAVRNG